MSMIDDGFTNENINGSELEGSNPFDESFYILPDDEEHDEEHDEEQGDKHDEEQGIILDLSGVASKDEFYARVRDALTVPDYFGNNLDALYDVLTEEFDGKTIIVKGMEDVAEDMRDYMKKFRKLCDDVCEENSAVKIILNMNM